MKKEGVQYNSETNEFNIKFIKGEDNEQDDLSINRDKDYSKKHHYSVYYGLYPKSEKARDAAEKLKFFKNIEGQNLENLNKIIILTTPSVHFENIILVESSKPLNQYIADIIVKKYRIPSNNIIKLNKKLYPNIDSIVNKERYDRADPTTQQMLRSYLNTLKKKLGSDAKNISISKSGAELVGGLQSGARRLLNSTFVLDNVSINKNHKYLVVDDIFIHGSTMEETFSLLSPYLDSAHLMGYVLVKLN